MNETTPSQRLWPLRSMLFIPAHKLDWVAKVGRYSPDAVVLDLEDAVPPSEKARARDLARAGIDLLRQAGIPAFVRINRLANGGVEDLASIVGIALSGVFYPKVEGGGCIRDLDVALSYAEGRNGVPLRTIGIVPIPETAHGLRNTYEIATASPRISGLNGLVGGPVSGDFARAAGFRPSMDGLEQLYFASKTILDSRAAGAAYPMAGLIGTRLDDLDHVRTLACRARAIGFAGAVVIHPSHVAMVNETFSPSAEEIAYASGLIDAMRKGDATGHGAVVHDGRMVDYAMIADAEATLEMAARWGLAVESATR